MSGRASWRERNAKERQRGGERERETWGRASDLLFQHFGVGASVLVPVKVAVWVLNILDV